MIGSAGATSSSVGPVTRAGASHEHTGERSLTSQAGAALSQQPCFVDSGACCPRLIVIGPCGWGTQHAAVR